jgi:hypothetical protein
MDNSRQPKKTFTTYLAGPIGDVSLGEARTWRNKVEPVLKEMGIDVLNPLMKEEQASIRRRVLNWSRTGNIDAIRPLVGRELIEADLEMVEKSDFVTLWLPKEGQEVCGCVDNKTEMLTMDGFKKCDELKRGEKVVSFNLNTKKLEVDEILDIFKFSFDGKLYAIEKRDLSFRATPNHRCVVLTPQGQLTVKTANKVWKHDKLLQAAPFTNTFNTLSRIEGRIVGLLLTDGRIEKYRVSICQKDGKNTGTIEQWLNDANIEYHKRFRPINKEAGHYGGTGRLCVYDFHAEDTKKFKLILPTKEKPRFNLLLNSNEFLEGVFEGITLEDGYRGEYGVSFSQKRKNIVDLVQALAVLIGKRCKISPKSPANPSDKFYYMYVSNHKATHTGQRKLVPYKGFVWCPRTNNGTWVARRNGTICITGNSYGEITYAFKLGIPVYIVTERRTKPLNIPYWAVGCSTMIFKDWDSYFKYIKENWTEEETEQKAEQPDEEKTKPGNSTQK